MCWPYMLIFIFVIVTLFLLPIFIIITSPYDSELRQLKRNLKRDKKTLQLRDLLDNVYTKRYEYVDILTRLEKLENGKKK